ncbi:STAS domain-containing protein [Krasilnikovia sp. M28-CT-15]|uniref:STAS domain-containing protein n=1 Tax=Krasilnikovia sp. M28-CT-15 TaxID=3373540 RepID=UPI003876A047
MTAVPAVDGTGVQVICDHCGAVAPADGCGIQDAEIVYVAVATMGWGGSVFARGPHRCPPCTAREAREQRWNPLASADDAATRVIVTVTPTAAIVQVTRDIDLDIADELRVALEMAVRERPRVVVDLTQAGTIDSAGLSTLVRARNAARHRNGTLLLAAPSRFVQTALRTMRLHTAFPTYGSVDQAVSAADGGRGAVADRRSA